ncbi:MULTISPECIES: type VII secretion-associated serine protease mycosin [unclassified Rhodococcus (in: high G+C Gram-positive bacteria)]|uniref:type VII secretion-associated serine protease mycosin n=1 Tax=unclassified Rhodococcus (in: high G+C Gram-positive bacteria) TaxID=192944 RepID=UPI00163ACE4F|nr:MULTISPECIES: type VII secretion-associated serine protease mycosin [unclassified Rhodococcus (in: high G+C Gram-positive bacteria)]MBC2643382.1 type VII secretion-associated serine protease mycosin [Rhodococcus sp. 3A]MBC2891878.1 type VII secretion-associated serine protease mycosin [Rhodococcus sp. 4CII]
MRLRVTRVVLATAIVAVSAAAGQGGAAAVVPAPIDVGLLPPKDGTKVEKRRPCKDAVRVPDGPDVPAAQRDLDFQSVWPISRGAGQIVAVIDTGVSRHPRLRGLMDGGDLVGTETGTVDCDAHGTLVAGLIGAAQVPGSGFSGGAPDSRILSIRQSSSAYSAAGQTDQVDNAGNSVGGYGNVATMATAIRRAADMGATVINISEVACKTAAEGIGSGDRYLGSAVKYAVTVRNAVVVAAAGNFGSAECKIQNPALDPLRPGADPWDSVSTIASPAWYDDYVLTVGSVEANGSPSDFSLAGPWVDVAAPGSGLTSLHPTTGDLTNTVYGAQGNAEPVRGTSFAAPYVSATVALVRSRFPQLSAQQVMTRIEATAHAPAEGWNPSVGHGIIDPLAAVTVDVLPDGAAVDQSNSVAIEALPAPAPPDRRPRDIAVAATGTLGALLVLGVLASFPLRRRFRSAPDRR